jgi:hypothetical protein
MAPLCILGTRKLDKRPETRLKLFGLTRRYSGIIYNY